MEDLPMIEIPDSPGLRREFSAYRRGAAFIAVALTGAALAIGALAAVLSGCTPVAQRAAVDVAFDTAACVVKHRNDTPENILIECGVDVIANPSARDLFATARAGADSDRLGACVDATPHVRPRATDADAGSWE